MIILLHGRARLEGQEIASVEAGDIIMLPANHEYGFSSVGPDGLRALRVTFSGVVRRSEVKEATLQRVLERNQARAQRALRESFFQLLSNGGLKTRERRARFRGALRIFSDAFQTFLFTRQAMCRDEAYSAPFMDHLVEELGHNRLLDVSQERRILEDPLLRATATWFSHQMLLLDNVDKAVVNLVLETAGYHFHSLAKPVFREDDNPRYFETHVEADEHHKDVSLTLLEGQHPSTYLRLEALVDDGWDMLESVLGRIAELVDLDGPTPLRSESRVSHVREILPMPNHVRSGHG
jgi:hypothetical protein